MTTALLSVRGLTKHYGAHVAVDGVDLEVYPGEIVGLIGESGCGKTTLVRTALGLVRATSGTSSILGQPTLGRPSRHAQLLFQDAGAALNPGLTVRETLRESIRVHGGSERTITETLERVDLLERADAVPAQLSGGEKRRATLAQLFIADPKLTVADEPTAGLDAARKADLLDLLLARRGPDRGYLIISHDLTLVLYCCTRVVVMDEGRIVDTFDRQSAGASVHPRSRALLDAAGLGGAA